MPRRLVILAGEESGDQHAAELIKELRKIEPSLQISGLGGIHMQEAGAEIIVNLARHGITGITGILKHVLVLKKAFTAIKKHLKEVKPDLVILVDSPGFNLPIAKFAKKELNLRIVYYISPQIWAWKAKRIHALKAYVDHMAVILPFEKAIYEKANLAVSYVGHPLVKQSALTLSENLKLKFNLPSDKKIIALLPGSRRSEIEYLLPTIIKSAEKLSAVRQDLHFVIPVAKSLKLSFIQQYLAKTCLKVQLIQGYAKEILFTSDCAVVASGTASLECALLEKPMCIIYKGSLLNYLIASQVIKVKYLGLCNLLANKMIVPELLQYDCNAEELTRTINQLLTDTSFIRKLTNNLSALKHSLSSEQADCSISEVVRMELDKV